MVHDYLEHIKYDTDSEHRLAENMLREKYVNIVGKELVESVIKAVKIFISQNREIFSSSYEVFNEYTIYAEDEMNIIDRLMVDHENREVKIVDYKTGEGYKQEQLDNYAEIIKQNLDAEYEIDTEFLIVELNKLKNN